MSSRRTKVRTIVKILREVTSLQVVSDFLKDKGLMHSASKWDDMLEKRIYPYVTGRSPKLTIQDLIQLLRDSEESGRQHVFLYKTSKEMATKLLDSAHLHSALDSMGIKDLLNEPKILDQPKDATFSDVRIDSNPPTLVIKRIETRISQKPLGEKIVGDVLTKRYALKRERAVNVIRLHADGLLEVKIGSHSNTSNYKNDIHSFLSTVKPIIPFENFREIPLSNLKDRLWNDRTSLSEIVKFSHSTLRNDKGTVLQAACGSIDYDLIEDEGATSSLDKFIDHDAFCDSSNIWFKKQESGVPTKDIHVLLSGESNEFALTIHCAKEDYEYVLSKIRELN